MLNYTERCLLWVHFLAMLLLITADPLCHNTTKCQCEPIYFYNKNYTCIVYNTRVEIVVGGADIKITCDGFHKSDANYLTYLNGIQTQENINNFILKNCPLPDKPFVSVFKELNLTNIHIIHFAFIPEFIDTLKIHQLLKNLTDSLLYLSIQHSTVKLTENQFKNVTNLEKLKLNNNSLYTLPSKIFNDLTQLITFELQNNKLTSLDEDIFQFNSNIYDLDFQFNALSTLPSKLLRNMTNLKFINIDYNRLTTLPEDLFENCPSLQSFSCEGNLLQTLPAKIFERNYFMLELCVSFNELEYLDDTLFNSLPFLGNLTLTGNRLKYLSSDIFAKLISLRFLQLNENHLVYFYANTFRNLRNVEIIDLSDNQLITNQDERNFAAFAYCRRLRKLNLRNNLLTEISFNLANATSLGKLDLSFNKVTHFEPEKLFLKVRTWQELTIDLRNNQIITFHTEKLENCSKNWCYERGCTNSTIVFVLSNNPINMTSLVEYTSKMHKTRINKINYEQPILCFTFYKRAFCDWPELPLTSYSAVITSLNL